MVAQAHTLQSNQSSRANNRVRIKTIALPAEHGGWGFLLEPIVLGLLLAPSIAGGCLALSAVGFFLARHPLTLFVLNRRRVSPRTALAKRFATLYLLIGAVFFILAFLFTQHSFIGPLLIAVPLAALQLAHEWAGRRRVLLSELSGVIAISSLATAIALGGGWRVPAALALWAIMIARSAPAILYVRACLGHLHRRGSSPLPMLTAHGAAVVVVGILFYASLAPRLAIVAMSILLGRALIGFMLARRRIVTAKKLGFSEIGFGVITVLAVALGVAFGY